MWNGRGMGKFLGVGWALLVPWEVLWDRKTSIVGPAIPYLGMYDTKIYAIDTVGV